jgi:Uncharacterised nucleotidyltransferase
VRERGYSHPTVEEQLILLSAGTSTRRDQARSHAARLAALADWKSLGELLNMRRLLPTLGPRLMGLAAGSDAGEFAGMVDGALAAGRQRAALLALVTGRVRDRLNDVGIRSTPLKGTHLSEAIYGDPGRRSAADIDLLVAAEQLREAVTVVCNLGYAPPVDPVDDKGLPSLHFALIHERGELPPVELHWRVHFYEGCFAEQRLLAPEGDPRDDWRPAPVDELAALLLFHARDGFMNLRLAADIAAWWDVFGSSLKSAALDDVIRAYPALERVLLAAAKSAEHMVGLPMGQVTARDCDLALRGRVAVGLGDPYPRVSEPQLYANMGLIDGLLAPRGGLWAFVKRRLIQPRQEQHEQNLEYGGEISTFSPLGYGLRILGRYGLAIVKLLHAKLGVRAKSDLVPDP